MLPCALLGFVLFCFVLFDQHVVWVGCSVAHIEVLVLTCTILDLDDLQMMTSSWFEQIHK
jgi:hypothetical protein